MLHRLALGLTPLARSSLDLDRLVQPAEDSVDKPVYIAGLARAGTTMLLRALDDSGAFHSLRYRDMPFIMMPRIWRRLSGNVPCGHPLKERAHGDRIQVNADSPEAFEEVFWRVIDSVGYITKQGLHAHQPSMNTIEQYRIFVQQVLGNASSAGQRYLCKNNNNIVRLPAIRTAFPDARIVLVIRDPIQHAASLLRQHERFNQLQQRHGFITDYMGWLGHYEFGRTHKPFKLSSLHGSYSDTKNINYWLALWLNTYQYLLDHMLDDVLLVSYENLCAHANETERFYNYCGVQYQRRQQNLFTSIEPARPTGIDEQLAAKAMHCYARLTGDSLRRSIT